MTDPYHLYDEDPVQDLVNDAIVAHAHSVRGFLAPKGDAQGRTRVISEKIQSRADALLVASLQRLKRTPGSTRQSNLVGHARPRSALTCSHGM